MGAEEKFPRFCPSERSSNSDLLLFPTDVDPKKLTMFLKEKGMKAYTFVPNVGEEKQVAIDILAEQSLVFRKMYTKDLLKNKFS